MTVSDDEDEEETNKDDSQSSDVKCNATRQMSRVAHNDRRLAEVREDLVTNARSDIPCSFSLKCHN